MRGYPQSCPGHGKDCGFVLGFVDGGLEFDGAGEVDVAEPGAEQEVLDFGHVEDRLGHHLLEPVPPSVVGAEEPRDENKGAVGARVVAAASDDHDVFAVVDAVLGPAFESGPGVKVEDKVATGQERIRMTS